MGPIYHIGNENLIFGHIVQSHHLQHPLTLCSHKHLDLRLFRVINLYVRRQLTLYHTPRTDTCVPIETSFLLKGFSPLVSSKLTSDNTVSYPTFRSVS